MYDVVIIGGGIIGASIAYELAGYQLKTVLIEKDNDISNATSKANSGIVHAGYDPPTGSLIAKLNVEGARRVKVLCNEFQVPYEECGSLVLAFNPDEMKIIEHLYENGKNNGVEGLKVLDGNTVREMEPEVSEEVLGALHAPTGAIFMPWEYALALAENAVVNGVELQLNSEVVGIEKTADGYIIEKQDGSYIKTKAIINAAGVHSGKIHNMVAEPEFQIVPNRGEYYLLDKGEVNKISSVLFQCPTKAGKGVLVSPTVHGNTIVGPNNEMPDDGEDIKTTAEGLAEVAKLALKSVPNLNLRENIRTFSGVRAASNIDDFIIKEVETAPKFFDVAGIKSPGLSAAPAIALYVVELLLKAGIELRPKQKTVNGREKVVFRKLSLEEKREIIKENSDYGQVICRCEGITKGEVIASINTPIPATTIEGVKRRSNAGMGRCQGGFCSPRVLEILAEHQGVPPTEILQDKNGSYILTNATKGGQK